MKLYTAVPSLSQDPSWKRHSTHSHAHIHNIIKHTRTHTYPQTSQGLRCPKTLPGSGKTREQPHRSTRTATARNGTTLGGIQTRQTRLLSSSSSRTWTVDGNNKPGPRFRAVLGIRMIRGGIGPGRVDPRGMETSSSSSSSSSSDRVRHFECMNVRVHSKIVFKSMHMVAYVYVRFDQGCSDVLGRLACTAIHAYVSIRVQAFKHT
jgi:hypothetical protein